MSDDLVCTVALSSYGYFPSLAAGITFALLFGIMTLFSVVQTFRRLWFISVALGGILETVGWIGRAVAHTSPCDTGMFTMQICCLIMGPAFFSAALYIVLGILIREAPSRSALTPKQYIVVFCSMDFLSLLLQAIGGAIASTAKTDAGSDNGAHIMVAGILFQLVGMSAFVVLGTMFLVRARAAGVSFDAQVLAISVLATLLIFLRNIYRAVELLQGWTGYVNTHEPFLIGLDGVPMAICLASLCYLIFLDSRRPGLLSREKGLEHSLEGEKSSDRDSALQEV